MSAPFLRARCPLVLASASPRRRDFLRGLGLSFTIRAAHIDERRQPGESPEHYVRRLAREKGLQASRAEPAAAVIAADTVVVLDGEVLGKPGSAGQALDVLIRLQGKRHRVITGLALLREQTGLDVCVSESTEVEFGTFSREVLAAYVQTGEPMDKAGGYGIQGLGGVLVRGIHGSCSNVIGLPLETLVRLLLEHDLAVPVAHPG